MTGIYKITNLLNGKSYIGKSENIEERFKEHKIPYRWKQYPNKILYKAFLKYGIDNFKFEVIEECDISIINDRERYWIKRYNTYVGNDNSHGYNMTDGGEGIDSTSQQYWWDNHEEIKQEMSKRLSGKGNPFYGKKHTENTRRKMKEAWKTRREDEEYKKRISEAHGIKIDMFDNDWNYIRTFNSISDANAFLNIATTNKTIKRKIENKEIYHGFYFEYHEENMKISS